MDPQPPTADGPAFPPDPQVVAGVEPHGDALVVEIVGEIDALTAPQLVGALDDALAQRPRVVVADLSKVDFFASAGIAALVDAHQKAADGVRFHIVAAGSTTLRVLELTGLTGELDIFASREDALTG
jgi:anti-sigma B factor antagonist